MSNKSGESSVKMAAIIVIAVVVGALILAGLYVLYQNVILPKTTNEVEAMIYTGESVQVRKTTNSVQYSYDGETWKNGNVPGLDSTSIVTNVLSVETDESVVWLMSFKSSSRAYACLSLNGIDWTPIYSDSYSINISKKISYVEIQCSDGRGYRSTNGIAWEQTYTRDYLKSEDIKINGLV